MIATKHKMLPPERLAAVAKCLKIPVKHVVEYHRFMHGHPTTRLSPATKVFIRERLSTFKFQLMDDAVGINPNRLGATQGTSKRTRKQIKDTL